MVMICTQTDAYGRGLVWVPQNKTQVYALNACGLVDVGAVNLVNSAEGKDTVRKEREYEPVSVHSEYCCKPHGLNLVSASNCSPKSQEIRRFIHHFCSLMVKNTTAE